jgi:hypothetical protein
MRRSLIWSCALFCAWASVASAGGLPAMTPSPDETSVEMNGNAQSDRLLGCYAKFQGPDLDQGTLGPARIGRTPDGDYVLRADFIGKDVGTVTVSRLMCWAGGFETQKSLQAPLYPAGTIKADAATESAIDGWRARREAAKTAAMTPRRLAPPDAATKQLLEGIWLVDARPDKGLCLSHWYLQTQIEFEFRKSGGRLLIFEPTDLFTAVGISGIERSGDVMVVQARARDGGLHQFMHIRELAADRLELLPAQGSKSQIAYKCGEPDLSVTSDVSLERLSAIAPPISGSTTLLAQMPGVSDDNLCTGRNVPYGPGIKHRSLQFELYGPAHYWLFGWEFWPEHKFAFDFVRSVEDRGDKGLILHMQEHLEKGDGWDVEAARGKTYDLTVLSRGDDHVEIPELATTFVRCKPTDRTGAGMARW